MKKALLVGCGGYGAGYVEEILKSGNKLGLALSGIVDPYAEQSRVCGLIRENRIPVYRDVPAYYRENRADVAVVSTPIPLHRGHAEWERSPPGKADRRILRGCGSDPPDAG